MDKPTIPGQTNQIICIIKNNKKEENEIMAPKA